MAILFLTSCSNNGVRKDFGINVNDISINYKNEKITSLSKIENLDNMQDLSDFMDYVVFTSKNDEIIYIGDSDVDMITSKKANVGLQICCTYGFRTVEELKPLAPKYMVSCPLEAQKIIEKALKK